MQDCLRSLRRSRSARPAVVREVAARGIASLPVRQAPQFPLSLRRPNGAVTKNVLPLPTSLVQPIRPPINSTKPLLMANPRPVPPYWRVVEESAWVKRSKIISALFAAIPIPVSMMLNRSHRRVGLSTPPDRLRLHAQGDGALVR